MRLPRFVSDVVMRNKAGFYRVQPNRFHVRVARSAEDYKLAFRLVQVSYVAEGIEPLGPVGLRIVEQHVLPESTVLLAYEGSSVVATMTVTLDSPAGLPLDSEYGAELAALRDNGDRLVEFGAFSVVRRCQGSGVAQMLCLAASRIALHEQNASGLPNADRIVIGVHPKVGDFYRAVWGFQCLGTAKAHSELKAPVLGLSVHGRELHQHVERHFPKPMYTGVRPADHVFDGPPVPGLELPGPLSDDPALVRWKMSREVFRELFFEQSDRISTLSDATRRYVLQRRSRQTCPDFGDAARWGHVARAPKVA